MIADVNNPTGTEGLIAVDKLGHRVLFLDPLTYEEMASLPMPPRPHEVALSPDRRLAYVSIYGNGVYGNNSEPGRYVAVIDVAARQHLTNIDVSPLRAPHGLMLGEDRLLYASCDASGAIAVLDPHDFKLLGSIDAGSKGCHMIALLGTAGRIYAENEDDQPFVTIMDTASRQLVGRVPMPNGAAGIVTSPDGKRVLVTDNKEPELAEIDTAANTVTRRLRLEGHRQPAQRVRFSPDGRYVVVTAIEEPLVTVLDWDSGRQSTFQVAEGPMGVAFCADGETALVANHHSGRLTVVNLPEARPIRDLPAGKGIETLAFY